MYNKTMVIIYLIINAVISLNLRSMENNNQRLALEVPYSLAAIIEENANPNDLPPNFIFYHKLEMDVPAHLSLLSLNNDLSSVGKIEAVQQYIKDSIKRIAPKITDAYFDEYIIDYCSLDDDNKQIWVMTEETEQKNVPITILLSSPLAALLNTHQITMTTPAPIDMDTLQKNVKNSIKKISSFLSDETLEKHTLLQQTITQKLRLASNFTCYTLPRILLLTQAIVIKKKYPQRDSRTRPIDPTLYYIPIEEEKTINKNQLKHKLQTFYSLDNVGIIDENEGFLSLYDDNEDFPLSDYQHLQLISFQTPWRKQLIINLQDIFQQINQAYTIRKQELEQRMQPTDAVDYLQEIAGYAKHCIMLCIHDLLQEKWFKFKISSNIKAIKKHLKKSMKGEENVHFLTPVKEADPFISTMANIGYDIVAKCLSSQPNELNTDENLLYLLSLSQKINFILSSLAKIFNHAVFYTINNQNDKLVNLYEKIVNNLSLETWQTQSITALNDIREKMLQAHHARKMELYNQGLKIAESGDSLKEITGYAQYFIELCISDLKNTECLKNIQWNDFIIIAARLEKVDLELKGHHSLSSQDGLPLKLNEISHDLQNALVLIEHSEFPWEYNYVRRQLILILNTLSKIFNHAAYYIETKNDAQLTAIHQLILENFPHTFY